MDNLCEKIHNINLDDGNGFQYKEESNTPDNEIYSIINNELEELGDYYYMFKKNKGHFCFTVEYNPKLDMYLQDKESFENLKKYLFEGSNALNIVVNKIYEKNPQEIINVNIVNYLLNNYYSRFIYNDSYYF
jgi:hypothetical protein